MPKPAYNRSVLTQPRLIVTEGPDDEAFVRNLIKERRLPECSIRNASDANKRDPLGWNDGTTGALLAVCCTARIPHARARGGRRHDRRHAAGPLRATAWAAPLADHHA